MPKFNRKPYTVEAVIAGHQGVITRDGLFSLVQPLDWLWRDCLGKLNTLTYEDFLANHDPDDAEAEQYLKKLAEFRQQEGTT